MPSLQIRDLPADIYETLSARATAAHRSLTQQAIAELAQVTRGASVARRKTVLAGIRAELGSSATLSGELSPEALIREDRAR